MPIIDRTVTLPAIPERIGDYLLFKTPANANVETLKDNTLYVLTQDDIGLVYLIRATPDGKSMVRAIGDKAATVQAVFAAGNPKESLQKLIAAPGPSEPTPELHSKIARLTDDLEQAFQVRVLATLPPVDDNPFAVGAEAIAAPKITPLKQRVPARNSNTIVAVLTGVAVFVLCAIGGLAFRQIVVESSLNNQTSFGSGVQLNYDSTWEVFSTTELADCNSPATGFTCYLTLRTDDGAMELLLGGVPSTRSVDLGQVEKDSFNRIQRLQPAAERIRTYYMKLSPKKIDAIRREMAISIRNTDLKRYGALIYFQYKGVLYELVIIAASKEVYDANAEKLDALIKGMTFN